MEIDEGPPPFPGVVVDDSFVNSLKENVAEEEDSEALRPQLPLPNDDFRSQSPLKKYSEEDMNDKGDIVVSRVDVAKFDEDEDDEWGDFGAAAPVQPVVSNPSAGQDDDDDEWGAFDQARPSTDNRPESESGPDSARSDAAQQIARQQSIDDWGSFENSATAAAARDDGENEWQAEFTAAAPAFSNSSVPMESLESLENMLDDEDFWDDGFEEDVESASRDVFLEDLRIRDIPTVFDSESLAEDLEALESEEKRFARLWLSLRIVEEAISLKFVWKESRIRTNHFAAIKISPKVVKKEPRTAAAIFDTSSLLFPTPLQPATSGAADATIQKTTSSSSAESPSIPAADFDWDTSGLTNPMNRANQNSAIIDVDFLSTNGVATSYTSPLQKELEEFGLVLEKGASGSGTSTLSSSSANILETILRANEHSMANDRRSPYRSPEVLSLDAQKLLEQLPDLHYLQSEVLMFPVGTNLPH